MNGFNIRCQGAGLAYQFGPEWFLKVCKQKTPGPRLKRLVKNRTTQNINRLGETMPFCFERNTSKKLKDFFWRKC
jgi:hypothetical protein